MSENKNPLYQIHAANVLFPTEMTTSEQAALKEHQDTASRNGNDSQDIAVKSDSDRAKLVGAVAGLEKNLSTLSLTLSLVKQGNSMAVVIPDSDNATLMISSDKDGLAVSLLIKGQQLPKMRTTLSELTDSSFLAGKFLQACLRSAESMFRNNEIYSSYTTSAPDFKITNLPVKSKSRTLYVLETTFEAKGFTFDVRATRNISQSRNSGTCFISERVSVTSSFGRFVVQDNYTVGANSTGFKRAMNIDTMVGQVARAVSSITYSDVVLMLGQYEKFRTDSYLADMTIIQDNGLISFVIGRGPGIDFPTQVNWLPIVNVKSGTLVSESDIAMTNPTNELGLLSHGSHTISNVIRLMKMLNCRGASSRKEMNYRLAETSFGRKPGGKRQNSLEDQGKKLNQKSNKLRKLGPKIQNSGVSGAAVPVREIANVTEDGEQLLINLPSGAVAVAHKTLTQACREEAPVVPTAMPMLEDCPVGQGEAVNTELITDPDLKASIDASLEYAQAAANLKSAVVAVETDTSEAVLQGIQALEAVEQGESGQEQPVIQHSEAAVELVDKALSEPSVQSVTRQQITDSLQGSEQ